MEIEVVKEGPVVKEPVAKQENFRAAYVLSGVLATLAVMAAAIGMLFPAVYRDKGWTEGAIGNDLVTLVVAVPVLVLAIIYSARGSVRARLLWLGTLYYMFYNYAFYVFGLPVTKLYVPIVAAFALSGFTFALLMYDLDIKSIASRFSSRTPARWIAGYLFFAAVMIARLWISQWVNFLNTGKVPDMGGDQNAYKVIAAVDLSFAVPLLTAAACTLWRRRPWGYVLSAVTVVQFAMYFTVMGTICVFNWIHTPGSHLFSAWFINCIVNFPILLLCLAGLLLNVKRPAGIVFAR